MTQGTAHLWLLGALATPDKTSALVVMLGLLLITIGVMLRLRKHRRRRSNEPGPREKIESMRQLRGMRGDLEDLMVEIDQLAKRFSAQLDAKSLQLQRLIDQAEQRTEQLQGLLKAAPESKNEPELPNDPLARSVYALADQGIQIPDIARQLDEHVGKVELILALRG